MRGLFKQNVCICIPTKNRAEMVKEVLEYTQSYYVNYNLKVIYFDSSENDDTHNIIEKYRVFGYGNLVWKHMDSNMCLDRKTFEILSKDEDVQNAEYIWLINDSIAIYQDALAAITEIIEKKYDLIRLPAAGDGKKEDFICNDVDEWFQVCSKGMAHMASTIMRSTLLKANPDWEQLYDKYIVSDIIGDEIHEYFFTIGLYLEQIAKLKRFSGIMIGKRMQWRRDSPCKKGRSYWNNIVIDVWARSYCETILRLPDCYTNKEDVIRCSDNIVYGRFERQSMIEYRRNGLLTEEIALKYKKYWGMVSTLSFAEIVRIASSSEEELEDQYGSRRFDYGAWEENVEKFEKKLKGKPIIVFGAGLYGSYVLKKLLQDGYADDIIGVAVSDKTVNLDIVEGFQVNDIKNFAFMKEEAEVLISTLPDAGVVIEAMLKKIGFINCHLIFEIADEK